MITKWIEKNLTYLGIFLFIVSYIIFWPQIWMITDSYNYSVQALAFSQGKTALFTVDFLSGEQLNTLKSPYSLGNAAYLSLFLLLFGKKGIFLASLLSVITSAFFLHFAIKRAKFSSLGILLLFTSIPILFFSRSLMSCLPSLLIVSIFLFLFSKNKYQLTDYFFMSFLAGISFWFRETNIVILGPILIYLLHKTPPSKWVLLVGGILGVSIKFVSNYLVFGDLWFMSASAGFSIKNIAQHAPVYTVIGLVLIPLGFLFPFLYKGKGNRLMPLVTLLFFFVYLCYNYTAVEYSGFQKGSILTSRFMIPLIPLFVFCAAEVLSRFEHINKRLSFIAIPILLITIIGSQYTIHKMYKPYEDAAMTISSSYSDKYVIYDQSGFTNIIRYINPFTGSWKNTADLNTLSASTHVRKLLSMNQDVFVIISLGTANQEKSDRSEKIKSLIKDLPLQSVEKITIDEDNYLEVFQVITD